MAKMDGKARAELAAALEKYDDAELREIRGGLEVLREELKDANTSFPATRAFLEARGLTHVRQLDAQGMKDLESHLRAVLASLTN